MSRFSKEFKNLIYFIDAETVQKQRESSKIQSEASIGFRQLKLQTIRNSHNNRREARKDAIVLNSFLCLSRKSRCNNTYLLLIP